jgi:hypothetical protein
MKTTRLLPLAGIAAVACLIVPAFALGGAHAPASTASGAEVLAFYRAHSNQQNVLGFVTAATALFIVLFAVAVAQVRSDRRQHTAWERVLITGSAIASAGFLVAALVIVSLANGATEGASPAALATINLLTANTTIVYDTGLGIMMIGAAGCLLSQPHGFRRYGWVALVLGTALLIPDIYFPASLLSALWIVAMSITLSRTPSERALTGAPSLT